MGSRGRQAPGAAVERGGHPQLRRQLPGWVPLCALVARAAGPPASALLRHARAPGRGRIWIAPSLSRRCHLEQAPTRCKCWTCLKHGGLLQ